MPAVRFLGAHDRVIGTIAWDGSKFHLDPPDSRDLRELLNDPVWVIEEQQYIYAKQNPELWIKLAAEHFNGAMMTASKVE